MSREELELIDALLRDQDLSSLSLEQQRAEFEGGVGSPPSGVTVGPVAAGGVACEWVTGPDGATDSAILALRGGGYCLGSLLSNRHFSALLSQATATRTLNVGYRSAPEHRFPAALHDALAAYRWLVGTGLGPSAIALAGNSAGGGLVLATLLALRDAGDELPACAAVISPWTDLAVTGGSVSRNAATDAMLDPGGIRDTAALYADDDRLTDPYVSPLYGDPTGLPPLLIHVSRSELLLDDSIRFADKARSHGVEVTIDVAKDMPHVWHLFAGLLSEADEALASLGAWVRRHLDARPTGSRRSIG